MTSRAITTRFGGALIAVLAAAALSSCGGSDADSSAGSASNEPAGGQLKSLAYAGIADSVQGFKRVGDLLERQAKAEGIELSRFDNKNEANAALQNARLMVQLKPDVFVDWSATSDANKAIGQQFTRAKKPCIAVNIPIPGCSFFNLQNDLLGAEEGGLVPKIIKERGWDPGKVTLLLVNAPAVGAFPNSGVYAFYSSYAKQFPSMAQRSPEELTKASGKIGAFDGVLVDGKGALQPSYTAVKQVLPLLPKDRKIVTYTMNDDSGMGALRALEQSNRADDFVIMSQGADANGLKQLRTNPNWIAEGSVFFDLWPSYVMAMSKALASGVKAPELTPAPQIVLTKETVDDYYKGMAVVKSPPVAPEAEYLSPFGIK